MDKATKEHFREKLLVMKNELIEALNSKYNEALELGSDGIQDTADEAYNLYNKNIMLGRVETDALNWLTKAFSGQMIIFTCHRREQEILKACGVQFHLVRI